MQYDLKGEKVLLLINVQKYARIESTNKKLKNFDSQPKDVKNIEETFKDRVSLDFFITENRGIRMGLYFLTF